MELNHKVGDKVYANWINQWTVGEVVKVTPSGMFDVALNAVIIRFKKDGRRRGGDGYSDWRLDIWMSFDDRAANLQRLERSTKAADAINDIKTSERMRGTWDKDTLMKEIDRLQAMVREARTLVEAI